MARAKSAKGAKGAGGMREATWLSRWPLRGPERCGGKAGGDAKLDWRGWEGGSRVKMLPETAMRPRVADI